MLNLFFACVLSVVCVSWARAPCIYSATRYHPPRCYSILWLQLSVSSWKRQFWKSLYFLATVCGMITLIIYARQSWVLPCDSLCSLRTSREEFDFSSVWTYLTYCRCDDGDDTVHWQPICWTVFLQVVLSEVRQEASCNEMSVLEQSSRILSIHFFFGLPLGRWPWV